MRRAYGGSKLNVTLFVLAPALFFAPARLAAAAGSLTVAAGITLNYPDGWSVAPGQFANVQELVNVPADAQATLNADSAKGLAHVLINSERRLNHADGLSRLKEIAKDASSTPTFLKICGWPALQRRAMVSQPHRGETDGPGDTAEMLLRAVTAVAVDSVVVRIEGSVAPSSSANQIADQVEAIARSLVCDAQADSAQSDREVEGLRSSWVAPTSLDGLRRVYRFVVALLAPRAAYAALPPRELVSPSSEVEVAVSPDGKNIVVCGQATYQTSNDGGVTFPFSGVFPVTSDGDCSVTIGKSGTFYNANLLNPSGTQVLFDVSTDNGRTFTFQSRADNCPTTGMAACSPDQEHIVADRVNAASGGDQIYVTWRNFNASGQDPALVCSQDSGANWTTPIDVEVGGFVPRIAIGQDGFVYVIYRLGGNIRVSKYSSCASGLVQQAGFPKTVHAVTDVTCPVPGLDRCNDGNILSSHMLAVDDTDANHLYVAYASNTVAGNENVFVVDSTNGGLNWGTPVQINAAVTGRRFMPWICPLAGAARVTWYDRRAAVGGSTNDLTDYFCGSASVVAALLTAGTEIKLTDAPDPECAAGQTPGSSASWPCSVRATGDSESCSVQPQLAGRCCDNTKTNCPGSQQRCDFSSGPACPNAGETCNGGGGCPKYGDYNGNACAAGRVYTVWASATPPSGQTAPGGIRVYYNSKLIGSGPDLQIAKSDSPDPVIAGTDLTYTITISNDGVSPASALNVTVSDTIPANTTFQSVSSATFDCSAPAVGGTGTVICTNAVMAPGEVDTITLVVRVDPATPKGATLSNTVSVSSADTDPTSNNSSTQTTTVDTQADLAITKFDFPDPVFISGSEITYPIIVTNNGPSNAVNVVVTDTVPTHTTFQSVTAPAGFTCSAPPVGATGTITCTSPNLPIGTYEFTIVVRLIKGTIRGTTISDTATISSDTTDTNPDNNSATATTLFAVVAPALSMVVLLACALLLTAAGVQLVRRRRQLE